MVKNKDKWSALSMKERADLIKLYVSNGITSLNDIKKHYDSFTTSKEEKSFSTNQSLQESKVNEFGPGGFMTPINPNIVEEQVVKKPLRSAAYRFGSDEVVQQKGYAGISDILRIINPFYEPTNPMDDNKTMFLYGNVNGLPPANNTNGKDFSDYTEKTYPDKNIKSYQGVLNPFNEYVLDERDRGLVEELAKKGKDFWVDSDVEYSYATPKTYQYRDDVASYNIQPVVTPNGVAFSTADLYDFGPDYNPAKYNRDISTFDNALGKVESSLLEYVGTPYILRQDNIPIRFINYDNSSEEDIVRAKAFKNGLVYGMVSDKDTNGNPSYQAKANKLDEKLAELLDTGYIEPAVVTAEAKSKGGKINRFGEGGDTENNQPVISEELDPSVVVDYSNLKQEAKDARDWVFDYYASEGYKNRARQAGLTTRNPLRKYIGIIPRRKIAFLEDQSVTNSYNGLVTFIGLQEPQNPFTFTSNLTDEIGFTSAHEFAHDNKLFNSSAKSWETPYRSPHYGNNYRKLPRNYFDALEVTKLTNPHDSEFSESYSDLIGLRYLLDKYGIFDSMDPNAKFDFNLYKTIIKDDRFKNNRFLKLHDVNQVIKAINEVAYNTTDSNRLNYVNPDNIAAFGGKLNIFNTNCRILSGEEDTESTLSGESPSKLRQNIRKAKVNAMRAIRQMQWDSPSKSITKVIQDTDDSRNFARDYYKNTYDDVAQDSFLFSKKEQENAFLNSGYIKGTPGDYGLVKKAVGDRDLPVYQTAKDDASREDLTVIGNISDIFFGKEKLTHAGDFPTAIYKDAEGNIYQKAWDLQDYGPDSNNSGGAYSHYDKIKRAGATLLDKIGNPVVRTTGFQKLDDIGIRALLIETTDKKLWEELINTSAKPIAGDILEARMLDAYDDYISNEANKKVANSDPNSEKDFYDFEIELRKNITFDNFKSNIEKYYSPETLEKKYFIF